jgi:multidrug efflux pump subunit AcrA (membrane-fusion protein)
MLMQPTTQLATADQSNGQSGPAPLPAAPGPRTGSAAPRTPAWRKLVNGIVLVLILVVLLGLGGSYLLGLPLPGLAAPAKEDKGKDAAPALSVELVKGKPHTLEVPADVGAVLGFAGKGEQDLLAVAEVPALMRPLTLAGSTALDPTRLARVRARFAPARVVSLGTTNDMSPRTGETEPRELRPGDRVRKADVLGVFYSVDVGSKKNDLLNALVQLELDQKILDNAEKHREAVSEVQMLTFIRAVQGDRNEISRALNNLEVWDIPQDEIDALHEEARKISADKNAWFKTREGRWVKGEKQGSGDRKNENPWGRVTLRAPFDGVIVERNLHVDEMVVDNTVNLFQIADVDRLLVVANAPEDDLPILEALAHEKRWWSVRTAGAAAGKAGFKLTDNCVAALRAADVPAAVVKKLNPLKDREFTESEPFVQELARLLDKDDLRRFQGLILDLADTSVLLGPLEEISYLIDPNQHTAIIKGYVANPGQRIRAGQYVSATVRVPRPAGVVEIPMDAVVDDGKQSLVFVQTDADKHQYTMRRVQVTHRFEQKAFVRSTPIPKKERLTPQEAEEGLLPKEPLLAGERVLQSGAGELKAALLELESQPKKEATEDKR